MQTYRFLMRTGLFAMLLVQSSFLLAQGSAASKNPMPIKRDVLLVLAKSMLNDVCENPKAPFACMSKTLEACRKSIPIALEQCDKSMKAQLPEEIKTEERKQWFNHVAKCIVENYIVQLGPNNINIAQCPDRK